MKKYLTLALLLSLGSLNADWKFESYINEEDSVISYSSYVVAEGGEQISIYCDELHQETMFLFIQEETLEEKIDFINVSFDKKSEFNIKGSYGSESVYFAVDSFKSENSKENMDRINNSYKFSHFINKMKNSNELSIEVNTPNNTAKYTFNLKNSRKSLGELSKHCLF